MASLNGFARSPWLFGPRVYPTSWVLSLLPLPLHDSGSLHHPGTCQLHAQTCLAILSPPSLTELPRGEVSGQHSFSELVKFPFSLSPIGCWLTGSQSRWRIMAAGVGIGIWPWFLRRDGDGDIVAAIV